MNMLDMLRRTGGLSAISNRLDITPAQSARAAEVVVPYLIAGFRRVFRGSGEDGLLVRLESLGGEEMAQTVLIPGDIAASAGDAALRLVFGSSEGADSVEEALRDAVELEPARFRDVMRLLAMLLGGYLAARAERAELGVTDGMAALLGANDSSDLLDAVLPLAGDKA